ncbi:ALP1-like protein [Tanacetum coccineum]
MNGDDTSIRTTESMSDRMMKFPSLAKCDEVPGDHGPKLRRKTYGYGMLSLMLRSNNDINVLYQYHLFNDLKTGRAPEIHFVANGVTYPWGYYLVDGIYPELATLVKTIPEPAINDNRQILYKIKQESARKDVERAFGVLKKKWAILANPA